MGLEDLCSSVTLNFWHSAMQLHAYKQFHMFTQVPERKFAALTPSRFFFQQTLRGLLKQLDALILYWTDLAVEDLSPGNNQVSSTLQNSYKRLLIEFVEYVLAIFNEFHALFQSKGPSFSSWKKK